MPTGIVKFFAADKGYGFITPDSRGADLFVHISNCADELHEGMHVEFEVRPSRRRAGQFEAVGVERI